MGIALKAVLQMHSDASKLLIDLDTAMQGYKSVFGNVATANLTYDVKSGMYMADGLFRHYTKGDDESQVRAVNLCFFDKKDPHLDEPLFVAAHLAYSPPAEIGQEKSKRY